MSIGERIARRRKELGMTQDELAKKTGYKSKAAISKIETNVNDITQSMVVTFAKALDTSVAYLMGWDQESWEDKKPVAADEKMDTLISLFRQMSPEVQDLILAQAEAIVRSLKSRDDS